MAAFKGVEFSERQSAAANAKKALLEKFKAKPGPGDPAFEQRQAERLAAAEARNAARERRLKEKQEAREAALQAEQAAREAEAKAQADLEAKREAEAKAARDARYAARKAKKK
jgi:membrane protein involved in colicin uptake